MGRGTQSADRGPESGPPKGSQWTAEDRQSVLTKRKNRVRGPRKSLEIYQFGLRNKKFEYPWYRVKEFGSGLGVLC